MYRRIYRRYDMLGHLTRSSKLRKVFVFVCCYFFVTFCEAFVPRYSLRYVNHLNPTILGTSLTTSSDLKTIAGDDDYNGIPQQHKQHERPQPQRVVLTKGDDCFEFKQFLRAMARTRRGANKITIANRMDDELKRMEIQYFNLRDDEAPKCRYAPSPKNGYSGPVVKPGISCFAMVCNAYAKAGMKDIGAQLAEDVLKRCDQYAVTHKELQPNAILKTAVLNAWVNADNWEKADKCLQDMEDCYATTLDDQDAPDCVTYTCYVEGLARSRRLRGEEIARRSLKVLTKMKKLVESNVNKKARPNRFTYVSVMKCQGRHRNGITSFEKVLDLYSELEDMYRTLHYSDCKPNSIAALAVFNAAAHCRGGIKAASKADEFLQKIKLRYEETGDYDYRPLEGMYTGLMMAYSWIEPKSASFGAKRVDELLEDYKGQQGDGFTPSIAAITSAMHAKANYKSEKTAKEAEDLLRSLENPDALAYQCAIKAYNRVGNAQKADDLIWEIQQKSAESAALENQQGIVPVDGITVAACIHAWTKRNVTNIDYALEKAENLLEIIIDMYQNGKVRSFQRHVDSWVFHDVIRLWSKSGRADAGDRIGELIDSMEGLHRVAPNLFKPSNDTFVLALDTWAQTGRKDAGINAMKLIRKMDKLHARGLLEEPNTRVLSSALTSVTRAGGRGAIRTAETLLERMIEQYKKGDKSSSLNARTLTSVLSLMLKGREVNSEARARQLLRQMTELTDDGLIDLAPNSIVYNCVLSGLAKKGMYNASLEVFEEMKDRYAKGSPCSPDTISFACLCEAIVSSHTSEPVAKLESLLSDFVRMEREGSYKLKADLHLFNKFIGAFSKVSKKDPTAADKANAILSRLEMSTLGDNPITPNIVSYASTCQAYAMSTCENNAEMAEDILRRAESFAEEGKLPFPDQYFYSSVVLAYSRSKAPGSLEKAENIISYMERLSDNKRDLKPNTRVYNILITGYAKSHHPERLRKAVDKYKQLEKLYTEGDKYCKPDVDSSNWLILATALSSSQSVTENRDTFEIAVEQFRRVHSNEDSVTPNWYTYEFFVTACRNLLPGGETREKLVNKAFDLCCTNGLLTNEFCVEAYRLSPDYVRRKLNGSSIENRAVIPTHFTKNLPVRRRTTQVNFS